MVTIKRYEHGGNFLKEKRKGESVRTNEPNSCTRIEAEYKEILSWEML